MDDAGTGTKNWRRLNPFNIEPASGAAQDFHSRGTRAPSARMPRGLMAPAPGEGTRYRVSKTMNRKSGIGGPALALLSNHWRALNFFHEALGTVPIGQHFVYLTLMSLHGRGWHPTVGELAGITGLARPSVSRHVSALATSGLVGTHTADGDRRRRLHRLTRRGESQRTKLIRILGRPAPRVATPPGRSR